MVGGAVAAGRGAQWSERAPHDIEALRKLRTEGRLPARVIDKILQDNPSAFYGL